MTFYEEIELVYPYLVSIRKLKEYLSFDIEFPEKWRIPKKYINEDKFVKQEKQNPGKNLVSFVSELKEDELNLTVENIKKIINFNKEIEQKEALFSNKVEELKKIFELQDIGSLKTLKFEINEFNLQLENDEQVGEPDELTKE